MSPRNSLLKRAIVPLLAVTAAAAFCAPAHAATATFNPCDVEYTGTSYAGIKETIDCTFTDDALWHEADCHCTLLGGDGTYNFHRDDTSVNMACGGGGSDYFDSEFFILYQCPHGTYNCWAVCRGTYSNNIRWDASTGGTYPVSF